MWSNASSSPVELRPAAPPLAWGLAGLALVAVAVLLVWSGVAAAPAAAALLLGAGGLGRAARRVPRARSLCSPRPGSWCVVMGDGTSQPVRLLRAWALGPWLAAASFAVPGGGRITVTLLCRDQAPGDWRRFLVRLHST